MYIVFSGAFECVRPSDRLCPSVRQILSVRPTDVRPSDRFAMGFATGFAMGLAWVFYTSHPRRARERPPKGAISRVSTKVDDYRVEASDS